MPAPLIRRTDRWLRPAAAARFYGVNPTTIYKWIETKAIRMMVLDTGGYLVSSAGRIPHRKPKPSIYKRGWRPKAARASQEAAKSLEKPIPLE